MSGFLCTMVGASFTVAAAAEVLRSKKGITAIGNAQIDTAQSKFGGSSALFDGTGDRLNIASQSDFAFGTGIFTIECWIRLGLTNSGTVWDNRKSGGGVGGSLYLATDNKFKIFSNNLTSDPNGSALSTNTWYHIAVVRDSNNDLKFYLDGTQYGSTITGFNKDMGTVDMPFYIGDNLINNYGLNGHIDEFRVSKSVRYTANFTPSTTPFVNDDNTVLLIHANGTDATTFFEDDNGVRAPKSLIANGNAQIDTAQSKFGGSSLLLDGTGDFLTADTNFTIGTGDFTIECWFRTAVNGAANYYIFDARSGANLAVIQNTNNINVFTGGVVLFGTTISTNTWYHMALVRSSGTATFYINGTGYQAHSLTTNFAECDFFIGCRFTQEEFWNGHLDEFRVSNTARYTANFTAPTAPFVNDSNTLLLIHADGTDGSTVFRDDNGTSQRVAKHISYYGNAQIDTAQSKFGGSSALFDGTGDYLVVQSNPLPTSGSFTVEFWIRFSSIGTLRPIWSNRDTGGTNRGVLYVNASGGLTWWNASDNLNFGSNLSANTWYHIACVKDGSTRRLFVDGGGMVTDSGAYTAGDLFQIGRADYTSTAFTSEIAGHIDEFRVSNTARYTANFTAPTAAFTNDANTVLLLHFNDADAAITFVDDNGGRASRGIVAIGNAQISTAQSKFGGSSALFDGTGDYLEIPYTTGMDITNGDFTIEFWYRHSQTNIDGTFGDSIIGRTSGGFGGFIVRAFANKITWVWDNVGGYDVAGFDPAADTWYHIAFVRSGTTLKCYTDGTERTVTGYVDRTDVAQAAIRIGKVYSGQPDDYTGHIDEVRISKSVRYTANFTAPTAPFQNDANTVLLLHMDGTNASTVFFDDNGRDTTPTA